MSNSQSWYDVGAQPVLNISCAGNLIVRGHTESSVVVAGIDQDEVIVEGTTITSSGTAALKLLVPRDASLVVTPAAGDFRVKNVAGSIEATADISGDVVLVAVQGPITLQGVHGELRARDVSESIAVTQIAKDVRARRLGNLTIDKVYGDIELGKMTGDIEINETFGDVAINGIVGALNLKKVHGDCVVGELGGIATITADDDIRIKGPLPVGKHTFEAGSTIALRYPSNEPIILSAYAPTILNTLTLETKTEAEGSLSGVVGDGGVVVNLKAKERISIKPTVQTQAAGDNWEGHIDSEFDIFGITEQLINDMGQRIDDAVGKLGPEISVQAERALRTTEEAVNQLVRQFEETKESLDPRQRRPSSDNASSRPRKTRSKSSGTAKSKPKSQSSKSGNDDAAGSARLQVLKMLEEGTLSVKEASDLLAAME